MDISLVRTFTEVAATGSFAAAADHLFITQSAVSLRIKRLEETLGRSLFTRTRAGAQLTPAGKQFAHYAENLVKLWEETRQQVAIPEGFDRTLTIGAQYSLWPRLGFRWIDRMQAIAPGLNVRAEVGMPDRLTRFLSEGMIHCALTYTPHIRPGLSARRVLQEELVLVATWPEPTLDLDGRYVFIDWGPEFVRAHAVGLPEVRNTGLTMALGALALDYVVNRRAAAYLPARYVQRHLERGELHLVPDAPRFPYPIWLVWRDDTDPIVRAAADTAMADIVSGLDADADNVLSLLAKLSDEEVAPILGDGHLWNLDE